MIYLLVLILLLIPVFKFDLLQKEGGRQGWYYFNLIILILLSGLRYRVGGDTLVYMYLFETNPSLSELSYFDFSTASYNPLWYIYNSLFKSINSFVAFQLVQSIIVNLVFFRFFKRHTTHYFTAIFIYYVAFYCYFNMEILREILCICIFMVAYPYLEQRKITKYYIFCIIALFIHFSSVVMLFIPILLLFKKESLNITLIICFSLIILLSVIDIIPLLLSIMFEGQMLFLAEHYFDTETNLVGKLYQFILCCPIFLLMYVRSKNDVQSDSIIGVLMMGCSVVYIFTMYIGGFARILNYFMPFYIIYIVNTFYEFYEYRFLRQISTLLISIALCIISFNFVYFYMRDRSDILPDAKTYHRYIPYYSILDPMRSEIREELMTNERVMDF